MAANILDTQSPRPGIYLPEFEKDEEWASAIFIDEKKQAFVLPFHKTDGIFNPDSKNVIRAKFLILGITGTSIKTILLETVYHLAMAILIKPVVLFFTYLDQGKIENEEVSWKHVKQEVGYHLKRAAISPFCGIALLCCAIYTVIVPKHGKLTYGRLERKCRDDELGEAHIKAKFYNAACAQPLGVPDVHTEEEITERLVKYIPVFKIKPSQIPNDQRKYVKLEY